RPSRRALRALLRTRTECVARRSAHHRRPHPEEPERSEGVSKDGHKQNLRNPSSLAGRVFGGRGRFVALGGVPQRVHFLKRGLRRGTALPRQCGFNCGEPPFEFLVGAAEQALGVLVEVTGEIDGGEQQVPNLLSGGVVVPARKRARDLCGLLAYLRKHRLRVVPVEADLTGLGLKLLGPDHGGQSSRYTGERTV